MANWEERGSPSPRRAAGGPTLAFGKQLPWGGGDGRGAMGTPFPSPAGGPQKETIPPLPLQTNIHPHTSHTPLRQREQSHEKHEDTTPFPCDDLRLTETRVHWGRKSTILHFCLISGPSRPPPSLRLLHHLTSFTKLPSSPARTPGRKAGPDLPLRRSVSDCLGQKGVLRQPGGPHRLPWR